MLVIETKEGERLEYEVVGIVEDEEQNGYAVCYGEAVDDFVVTDAKGAILEDEEVAQGILDDFLEMAAKSSEEPGT